MTNIPAFFAGVDWSAVALAVIILNAAILPWLWARNEALPDLCCRVADEEKAWLDEHTEYWDGHFKRYESLPSYGRMLFSLWKPIKEFETDLKPVAEYYKVG
jgi:hypothetical protein